MSGLDTTGRIGRQAREHDFASVIGHDLVRLYLSRAVDGSMLPHAFLFHGPRGTGKTSLAYGLIKYVIERHDGPRERSMELVRKVCDGVSSQVVLVEPKGPADQITLRGWKPGSDDPENLQYYRFVETRPLEGAKKFVIIRRSERMNVALANYLLKLIEEPPPYLGLILVTERPGELLPTIRSRCAPVCLGPVPEAAMRSFGEALMSGRSTVGMDVLLRLAAGSPGRLIDLVRAGESGLAGEMPRLMGVFRKHGFLALFRTASDLLIAAEPPEKAASSDAEASAFEAVLDGLLAWFRDALLLKALGRKTAEPLLAHSRTAGELESWSAGLSMESLVTGVDGILGAYGHVPRRSDKNYVLESLLMRFGRAMRT